MKIAVFFDGAGLARLGLELAGHDCTGFEIDPLKHHLSKFVGSGNCVLADATKVDYSGFDAVWASPPCQWRSGARTEGAPISDYSNDLLGWSLEIKSEILWVENVFSQYKEANEWGIKYNAAQFLPIPIQNRNRIIGGKYKSPYTFREYKRRNGDICPCITATEWNGSRTDKRRASKFYGRKLTLEECAWHQGFQIPKEWYNKPNGISEVQWKRNLYEAIGNGVPVYMAYAFGAAYVCS